MFGLDELKDFKDLIIKQAISTEKINAQMSELIKALQELTKIMETYVRKG